MHKRFAPVALLTLLTLLALGTLIACSAEGDTSEPEAAFTEDALSGTYTDRSGSFRYIDTHDNYANTQDVDRSKFLYFRRVNGKQAVGLTMDCAWVDAPNALNVLDVLKRHNVKITFFIAGPFLFKNLRAGLAGGLLPESLPIIRRMIEDGHEFGSHSHTHPHNNQSVDWVRENDELLKGWNAALATLYPRGNMPKNAAMLNLWRAPYGEYDPRSLGLAAKAGFPYHFGWNVDVKDAVGFADCRKEASAKCLTPAKLTDTVLGFGERNRWSLDGFVVLAHLQNPYMWGADANGLDRLINTIESKNHVIAKLSDMFIETAKPAASTGTGGQAGPVAVEAGNVCAPGCIYSAFCTSKNANAKRYGAPGSQLICVKSGDCASECSVSR